MTTINCTLNCIHQKDGKCILDDAEEAGCSNDSCAYFSPTALQNAEKTAK